MSKFMAIAVLLAFSCTDQQRAKMLGGSMDYDLPANQKLVNVTWKDDVDVWILTRPMLETEKADTLVFSQNRGTTWNIYGNGSIRFIEHKENVGRYDNLK